ncbi:MAG: hypothetical protein JNM00_05090, partial [Flavobacteriales bacterium]|nr:hypothetical protein [Flavobacteriales bacterium]
MTLPKSSFRGWCLALCVALLSIAGKAQVLDSLVFGVYDQGTWPEEVSWNIVNADGDIVLAGDGYDATYSALLNSGCYTINMYDSFGDGWTGGTLTLYVGDDPVPLVFTLTSGSYGQESFGINAEGCGPLPVQGCTDPTALNYNWLAEEDDGSCEYCNGEGSMVATVYVCTFSNGGQVELQVLDGDGNELLYVEGLGNSSITYYEICLSEGECYTINMFNNAGPFGWYGGYFWINGNGVQYVNQSLDAGASSESTFFSIDNTCSPYPGCTDPEAVNYDENANIDDGSCVYEDCDTNFALVTVTQGTFPGEVGWSISDADGNLVASGGAPYFGGICLDDGCYTIIYSDSFGDGWNGAVMSIEGDAVSFSGTLNTGDLGAVAFGVNEEGCEPEVISGCTNPWADNYDINAVFDDGSCIISGCTDPTAINYDYSANNDDGSCEYCDGEGSMIATLYVCTFSNGGQVELQLTDDQGNEVIYVSGLSNGTIAYFDLCLQPGTCYTVTMINNTGAYGWYGGYYWINGGGIQLSTGALYDGEETSSTIFSIDGTCGPVYGCTDPSAINYDPEATANDGSCQFPWYGCTDENAMNYNPWANTDDGSCVYPEDCTQNLVEFVTNGGFFPSEIAWYAYDLDFNYVASNDSLYSNSSMACIGDECLFIYLYDSFGDGWNGGSVD